MSHRPSGDPATTVLGLPGGAGTTLRAEAPGRVNLIGEHTDYSGGLALPLAVHLTTTVTGERGGGVVRLSSPGHAEAVVDLDVDHPEVIEPAWARYVAGVVAELRPTVGFVGEVRSTVPEGAGLSSSAALELAVALALGFEGSTGELARLAQRAEQTASGVPCGLMDQLTSACGVEDHAVLLDLTADTVLPVAMPPDLEITVVHSGQESRLAGSDYADRRRAIERVAADLGPLRSLRLAEVATISDPVLARRARHVVSENERVLEAVDALGHGDVVRLGTLATESHRSLREDFQVSTAVLDELVEHLLDQPGVLGARLTGAGFGGCVVALARPGALDPARFERAWRVHAAAGAAVDGHERP